MSALPNGSALPVQNENEKEHVGASKMYILFYFVIIKMRRSQRDFTLIEHIYKIAHKMSRERVEDVYNKADLIEKLFKKTKLKNINDIVEQPIKISQYVLRTQGEIRNEYFAALLEYIRYFINNERAKKIYNHKITNYF